MKLNKPHKFKHIKTAPKPEFCNCCGAKATTWEADKTAWCTECTLEVLLQRSIEVITL